MKPPKKPDAKLPIVYEDAVRDLIACQTLDEAKHFADKSEALAAWARIYKSDEAALEAKRLRLHAYRRMNAIAEELRPFRLRSGNRGFESGAASLLQESGLSRGTVNVIRAVGKVGDEEFRRIISLPRPPSPIAIKRSRERGSNSWKIFSVSTQSAASFRVFCRRNPAKDLARGLSPDEAVRCREWILEFQEWLDTFEQYLPAGPA